MHNAQGIMHNLFSLSQNDYPVFFQKVACATFPRIKRFVSSTQVLKIKH